MTRDEVFAFLESKGVEKVRAEFSGGGDEGGVAELNALDKEGKPLPTQGQDWDNVGYYFDDLLGDLDEFSFDGGNYVNGVVTITVSNKSILVEGEQQEWVDFDTFFVE